MGGRENSFVGYEYNDASKNSWGGPSINGWRETKVFLSGRKEPRPALEQFIEHGYTNRLAELSRECTHLAEKCPDEGVRAVLTRLAEVARKADEIVVLVS
jgi:hypothetical protein